ncbi:MAG: hypothetical protein ACOYON_10875 [Fimbriimonas sp.]
MPQLKLINTRLKDLFKAIEEEAKVNVAFAERLETILCPVAVRKPEVPARSKPAEVQVPDVFGELIQRGEEEFGFWLRTLDLETLRAIVRANGYDPQRRAQKWKNADKFVELINAQTIAKKNRGSSFLRSRDSDN